MDGLAFCSSSLRCCSHCRAVDVCSLYFNANLPMQESSQRTTIERIKETPGLMRGIAIQAAGLVHVMRTIRRQVYVRDRRLALLQLRQGKCRCAVTVRTSAGCPRRGCASPTPRTFRPVVARISRKPYFGLFEFPAFALHHFLFCVATKNSMASQQDFAWQGANLGGDLATPWGEQLGGDPRDGTLGAPKEARPQSLMCHRPIYRSPHISAPITL
jgi:hypothetical protein